MVGLDYRFILLANYNLWQLFYNICMLSDSICEIKKFRFCFTLMNSGFFKAGRGMFLRDCREGVLCDCSISGVWRQPGCRCSVVRV